MTAGLVSVALLPAGVETGQRAGAPTGRVTFRDVASEVGLRFTHVSGASPDKWLMETMGSGGLFLDFDADGWIDVFLVDGGSKADPAVARTARHRLFRNTGGGRFEDVTAGAGLRHSAYGMGACAADYDNDGRVDIYVTSDGANALFRNEGGGRFADVTRTAGVGSPLWSTSCAFADVDRDGDLDLFVTNYVDLSHDGDRFCGNPDPPMRVYCHPINFPSLPNTYYRNDGDGTFTDATASAGLSGHLGNGLGVAISDYDGDLWPDVFVANDAVPDFLFHNEGGTAFTEMALLLGVAVSSDGLPRAGMGTAFGDYDGDGRLDLVVTNHETEMHSLFRNVDGVVFEDVTVESGVGPATLPHVGFGVVFLDHDNDGDLDLAIVNGHVIDNVEQFRAGGLFAQRRLLLENTGGRFRDASRQSGPAFTLERVGRGLAAGDVDNDGDLDLLVTNNGGAVELLRNEGGNRENAVLVRLVGMASNRDGIGARLRLVAGSRTLVREVTTGSSYLSQGDTRVHFGLGAADRVDRLEVSWPSGREETISDVPANAVLTIREGEGVVASVPFAR